MCSSESVQEEESRTAISVLRLAGRSCDMHVLILVQAAGLPAFRGIEVMSHRRDYERPSSEKLEVGRALAYFGFG